MNNLSTHHTTWTYILLFGNWACPVSAQQSVITYNGGQIQPEARAKHLFQGACLLGWMLWANWQWSLVSLSLFFAAFEGHPWLTGGTRKSLHCQRSLLQRRGRNRKCFLAAPNNSSWFEQYNLSAPFCAVGQSQFWQQGELSILTVMAAKCWRGR